jgi:Na+/proline symporter
MSERDRMDRIERKLNRIGRFVLFAIGLLALLVAMVTERFYDDFVFGYGRTIAAVFVVLIIVIVAWARIPFRD